MKLPVVWLPEADAELTELDPADIAAEELVLERQQSARPLIEAVDGLLTDLARPPVPAQSRPVPAQVPGRSETAGAADQSRTRYEGHCPAPLPGAASPTPANALCRKWR